MDLSISESVGLSFFSNSFRRDQLAWIRSSTPPPLAFRQASAEHKHA
jgi:hypothetical protein